MEGKVPTFRGQTRGGRLHKHTHARHKKHEEIPMLTRKTDVRSSTCHDPAPKPTNGLEGWLMLVLWWDGLQSLL